MAIEFANSKNYWRKMKTKIVISFSGGMDSATLLVFALHKDYECIAVGLPYGSKHNEYEIEKAKQFTQHYKVPFKIIDLKEAMKEFKSDLLLSGGEIPEGNYDDESMSRTVVPARNLIFASILSGYTLSIGAEEVWLGIHSGDHTIYPDCRPDFYVAMAKAIRLGTDQKIGLKAPFLLLDKAGILALGLDMKVPYELTRTCYKQQRLSCGKCGSCRERLEAFSKLETKDPIRYMKYEA